MLVAHQDLAQHDAPRFRCIVLVLRQLRFTRLPAVGSFWTAGLLRFACAWLLTSVVLLRYHHGQHHQYAGYRRDTTPHLRLLRPGLHLHSSLDHCLCVRSTRHVLALTALPLRIHSLDADYALRFVSLPRLRFGPRLHHATGLFTVTHRGFNVVAVTYFAVARASTPTFTTRAHCSGFPVFARYRTLHGDRLLPLLLARRCCPLLAISLRV